MLWACPNSVSRMTLICLIKYVHNQLKKVIKSQDTGYSGRERRTLVRMGYTEGLPSGNKVLFSHLPCVYYKIFIL